jgi:hypothetical protein
LAFGHAASGRFEVHVTGIGVVSAQGNGSDILHGDEPLPAQPSPWPPAVSTSAWCRPVPGINPTLTGPERWNALARRALAPLGMSAVAGPPSASRPALPPLLVASCNGGGSEFDGAAWRRAFDSGSLLA